MFADKYLQKNKNIALIADSPADDTGMIVVIPCLREPEILQTLESIGNCRLSSARVEVIVLINHSEAAAEEIKAFNRNTKTEIVQWIDRNPVDGIRFYAVGPVELKKKWAGAGLARKSGMDEAVRRFNLLGNEEGIIVSLDADTLVDKNYLVAIEDHFKNHPKQPGATISFSHQTQNLPEKQKVGIGLYEKYLSYYREALAFSGYPHAMFTVGSAFAVKAAAYVKRGGMNRRQAGEDFYFLQNLVQMGTVGEITSTRVYPSARLSDRVPFGTGPILQKWMDGEEDLRLTYDFQAFIFLKAFFDRKTELFQTGEKGYESLLRDLPGPVSRFLEKDHFRTEVADLNKNCSTLKVFGARFFQKFNAFKILKYLNFVHEDYFVKVDLEKQVARLNRLQQEQ